MGTRRVPRVSVPRDLLKVRRTMPSGACTYEETKFCGQDSTWSKVIRIDDVVEQGKFNFAMFPDVLELPLKTAENRLSIL